MAEIDYEVEVAMLTDQYKRMFGEMPPLFGYTLKLAAEQLQKALDTGKEMPGAEKFAPKGAII